jgi:hypothetical protein
MLQGKMRKINRQTLGRIPSKYVFVVNPYYDVRFSRCPQCRRATHYRKFALLIHLEGIGLRVLGKTCRYCTRCELIIVHKSELVIELARISSSAASEITEDSYLIIGTVNLKTWQRGLQTPLAIDDILNQTAEFKQCSMVQR